LSSKNARDLLQKIGVFFAFLIPGLLIGQTQIYLLDFETAGGYTTSTVEFTDNDRDYFTRLDASGLPGLVELYNVQGSYFFGAQDIDGEGASSDQTLTITGIDITGATGLEFRVYLAEDDDGIKESYDKVDYVHFDYQIDGGGYLPLLWVENSGSQFNTPPFLDPDFDGDGNGTELTDTLTQFIQAIAGTGSSLDIRISFDLDGGEEDIAIDNIEVYGTTCSVSTITSFTPTSTTTGQTITITGTGFDAVNTTSVEIGGVPATSFTVVSATEISAVVGAGASSGDVEIITAGCPTSLSGFTYLPCIPPTISDFTPIEGPEGTWVTITGSDFAAGTGTDSVWMGGELATIISVSSTELVVQVPSTMSDSTITIKTNGCQVTTEKFGFIKSTPCSSGSLPDLIISELHDTDFGSRDYVEIYNGTGADVDLSDYIIRVYSNGNSSPHAACLGALSGTLQNDSVRVYSIGSSSIGPFGDEYLGGCGINEDDCVKLLKDDGMGGTTEIDVVGECDGSDWTIDNLDDFTYIRRSTVLSPSTTFNAAEWIAFTSPITDSLGSHTFNQGPPSVVIDTQPVSDTVCEGDPVSFSIATSGGSPTYQWHYVTPLLDTFQFVPGSGIFSGETSTTLNLSTTTTTENFNQFYIEVTDGACILRSSAVQLTVTEKPSTSSVFHN